MAEAAIDPVTVLTDIHKVYGSGASATHVLKGIGLVLRPGELVVLKGRSGSGKTTLMNIIGGLDSPTQGEAMFGGKLLHRLGDRGRTALRKRAIGFIFQSFALHPLLSAGENVELGLRMASLPPGQWQEAIACALDQVGMSERASHRPYELSGGEQQRVAIAKAIAARPRLLLADEPTAELDTRMSARIMQLFRRLRQEGMAICMTTHDPTMLEVADHVYEMADGRLQA